MKDGIEYDDPEIQKAINEKFSSEQLLVTQQNKNAVTISEAEANAQAKLIEAEAEKAANSLISSSLTELLIEFKRAENEKEMFEKWNGQLSEVQGMNSTWFNYNPSNP